MKLELTEQWYMHINRVIPTGDVIFHRPGFPPTNKKIPFFPVCDILFVLARRLAH